MTDDPLYSLPSPPAQPRRLLEGRVSTAPASPSDLLGVTLDARDYDGPELDDCPWTPRPELELPSLGDLCLVAMTRRRAWVVTWWPYDA